MGILDVAAAALATFPDRTINTPYGTYSLAVVMTAIAGAESTWTGDKAGDPLSIYQDGGTSERPHSCDGMTSFGCWQINLPSHYALVAQLSGVPASDPCGQAQWLYDYGNCAKAALSVYQSQGLAAWSTWGNAYTPYAPGYGPYHEYLGQSQAAVSQVSAAGLAGTPKFSLSILSIAPIYPGARPVMRVLVSNSGGASGKDTVTATTRTTAFVKVSEWSYATTPNIPPGGTSVVSITQVDTINPKYADQELQVIVVDDHGNEMRALFTVGGTPSVPGQVIPTAAVPGLSPWAVVAIGLGLVAVVSGGVLVYRSLPFL